MATGGVQRSPTFLVGTERQRGILQDFQRREQQFSEHYHKNKPLCFSARAYQKTHPGKAQLNHKDADATLVSPMLLGVADGVSQLEDFGLDAALLPKELLRTCEELSVNQLIPGSPVSPLDSYRGPVSLLKDAYEATESLGSTTILLAVLDNSTTIHGKLHPMVAVLSIGDCQLLMLRRIPNGNAPFQAVFHTEMQRIQGNVQTPLQLARVDDRIDPEFDERLAIEVIERGSAVHCISAYEGDILVLGSDGVFDNLFLEELVGICNELLRPALPREQSQGARGPPSTLRQHPLALQQVARRIVDAAHAKCGPAGGGTYYRTPIGPGGKADDTSVVVGEVMEWTQQHSDMWAEVRRKHQWDNVPMCGNFTSNCSSAESRCRDCNYDEDDSSDEYVRNPAEQDPVSPVQKPLRILNHRPSQQPMPPANIQVARSAPRRSEPADDDEVCSIS